MQEKGGGGVSLENLLSHFEAVEFGLDNLVTIEDREG